MANAITVERAAQNALGAWLKTGLGSFAEVSLHWPSGTKALPPKAVTILRAGPPSLLTVQPELDAQEDIHATLTATIATDDPADATDLAGTNALLNACKASFEAHRVDVAAHASVDAVHAVSAPDATDLPSGIALATEMLQDVNEHLVSIAHAQPDEENAIIVAQPFDVASLVAAAIAIKRALRRHYVARIYWWKIHDCTQPMQLDVWAKTDHERDQLLLRLRRLLNAPIADSAPGIDADAAISFELRFGVLLELGDGYTGVVDFEFDAPDVIDSPDARAVSEFRAMYRGVARFDIAIRSQHARLASVTLATEIGMEPIENAQPGTHTMTLAWSSGSPGYTTTHSDT